MRTKEDEGPFQAKRFAVSLMLMNFVQFNSLWSLTAVINITLMSSGDAVAVMPSPSDNPLNTGTGLPRLQKRSGAIWI